MSVTGIIAEYNPFHRGHEYHVREARRATGCEYVVAVMGGSFTQRGEPALIDKWARAEMALRMGVDLVIELPTLFAVRSADWFARGGVRLLGALGVVDAISFGCEIDDLYLLERAADLLEKEPPAFKQTLAQGLSEGQSHARARGEALKQALCIDFNAPNTALALEYLSANRALRNPMRIALVRRVGAYHDLSLTGFASASAVRKALFSGAIDDACAAIPKECAPILLREWPGGAAMPDRLDGLLLYALRGMEDEEFSALPDRSEGLEMRVKKACREAVGREELLMKLKCKRYTHARLSRMLTHALLGMNRTLIDQYDKPPYARILGFRESAAPLLNQIKRHASIPLITDPMRIKRDACFGLDQRATDTWGLLTDAYRKAGRDFTHPILKLP